MLSMWRDTAAMPEYGRLEGDVRTDVLVIGGGMKNMESVVLHYTSGKYNTLGKETVS